MPSTIIRHVESCKIGINKNLRQNAEKQLKKRTTQLLRPLYANRSAEDETMTRFDDISMEAFMEDNDVDVGSLFAQELNSLSLEERNALFERIHGVESIETETEELLSRKLEELRKVLVEIDHKPAYSYALGHDKTYMTSRKFQLMFLRADSFDARKAAHRIMEFMEEKLRRFGPKTLTRPLALHDLSISARSLLVKKGMFQLLPTRDRVGRALFLTHHHFSNYRTELKQDPLAPGDAAFYVLMAASEDEDTQRKGIVSFIVVDSIPHLSDLEFLRQSIKRNGSLNNALPIKFCTNHVWLSGSSQFANNVFGMISAGMGRRFLLQTKLHSGSYEETKYKLMTYGIPVDHLPFSLDGGELRLTAHQKWLRRRPAKEAEVRTNIEFQAIDVPSCYDVCLQRGTSFHHHQGNLFMRAHMQLLVEEYQTATSVQRKALNLRVIQAVRDQGGRFLSKKDGGWFEEIKEVTEINKCIGASFRSMIARNAKQGEKEDSEVTEMPNKFLGMDGGKRPRPDDCCLSSYLAVSDSKRSFHR